jgi:hypothetical protein
MDSSRRTPVGPIDTMFVRHENALCTNQLSVFISGHQPHRITWNGHLEFTIDVACNGSPMCTRRPSPSESGQGLGCLTPAATHHAQDMCLSRNDSYGMRASC